MLERLVIIAVLAALGVGVFYLVRCWNLRRVGQQAPVDPLLQTVPPGTPAIVYFTTPGCIPCQTQQKPALARLQQTLGGGVHIIQVDAAADPEAAARWGVMTAPTTFVLDGQGKPGAVNYGVATTETLLRQLQQVAA